jgi:chemotaxis protein MotB
MLAKKKRIVTGLLVGLVLTACMPGTKSAKTENRLENYRSQSQNEIRRLETENTRLTADVGELNQQNVTLQRANEQLTENIKNLSEQTQKLKAELDRQRSMVRLQQQVIKLLDDTKKTIESSLRDQIDSKGIEIVDTTDRLKVVLTDKILFDPGSQEISAEGKKLLLALAESFKMDDTYHIVVEGHTDNVPLGKRLKKLYPTNWELAAARAGSVVRFLQWQGGVDPKRLSLVSYASYRPVVMNSSEEGRRQNRRIVITLGSPQ